MARCPLTQRWNKVPLYRHHDHHIHDRNGCVNIYPDLSSVGDSALMRFEALQDGSEEVDGWCGSENADTRGENVK